MLNLFPPLLLGNFSFPFEVIQGIEEISFHFATRTLIRCIRPIIGSDTRSYKYRIEGGRASLPPSTGKNYGINERSGEKERHRYFVLEGRREGGGGGGEQCKWSCLPAWVHYDYFNNGNIRRAFDEKSEFNEKFTDGAAIMTVQLHKQYRSEIGAVGPLPYHPPPALPLPPHKYNINTKGAKIAGHFTGTGDIILYKSESIHQNVRFHLKTATRILLIQHYK